MTAAIARAMTTPAQLKEFRADFEAVRLGSPTALLFLSAARRRATDARTMKRTRLAALEVARALHRMHTTESYHDSYDSWAALVRALKISRQDSYDLMNMLEVLDGLPAETLTRLDNGLSRRQFRVLAKVDPEERAGVVEAAADEGDATPAGLERLRQQLQAGAREEGRIEAEAPKQPKTSTVGPVKALRRHLTIARNVRLPEDAPPELVDQLMGHLDDAEAVLDQIAAHLGEPEAQPA